MSDLLPDAVVRYDEHADGLIDVHLPTGRAARVVVLVHGGFWKTEWDRKHTREMARALSAEGFCVATPEYRRVGPGGEGGWLTTGADVRRAVERLPDLLEGIGVRPRSFSAIGHSAGGHLVLWLASTGLPLGRTVALAPVADVHEAIRLGLGSDAARAFLGAVDPDEADPARLLENRPKGEVRIVHGTRDDVVPVHLSRNLVGRHPWIDLREVDADHFEVIEPGSAVWPAVLSALAD